MKANFQYRCEKLQQLGDGGGIKIEIHWIIRYRYGLFTKLSNVC